MKNMKKIFSIMMTLILCISLTGQAFAADALTTEDYAYMSTENVSPALRDKILAAPCEIVYGTQAWTIGGVAYRVLPDGTKASLPEFSDLFPDWDPREISAFIRTYSEELSENMHGTAISPVNSMRARIGYDASVNIPVATMAGQGLNFYSFTGDGSEVWAYAKTIPGNKYNIAIYDDDLKEDVAYEPNTIPGKDMGCHLVSEDGHRYDCRVSSADKSGDAHMIVIAE